MWADSLAAAVVRQPTAHVQNGQPNTTTSSSTSYLNAAQHIWDDDLRDYVAPKKLERT